MLSPKAVEIVKSLDREIGEGWCRHQLIANACDDLLHCIIGDGVFTTKIDGFIHAVTMTTPFILKHLEEIEQSGDDALDLEHVTSWSPRDSAMRYAHWQVDFHWKIDTRLWQYVLYAKFMRRSYHDAISSADGLNDEDRHRLLNANLQFWDAVEVAYSYRFEILERSRQFAPHPDKTAGASEYGYVYRRIVPEPIYEFRKLRFESIGPEFGAGTDEDEQVPVGFPKIPDVKYDTLTEAARIWVHAAKDVGLCDDYLRVRLGERLVPTRLNGWEAALQDLRRYICLDQDDTLVVALRDMANEPLHEEVAHFFVQTQTEFGRHLKGLDRGELLALVETAQESLGVMLKEVASGAELCADFLGRVRSTYDAADTGMLPERYKGLVDLIRPVHPRYAELDPLEPLPWHTRNPARYLQRMRRLGYEL